MNTFKNPKLSKYCIDLACAEEVGAKAGSLEAEIRVQLGELDVLDCDRLLISCR